MKMNLTKKYGIALVKEMQESKTDGRLYSNFYLPIIQRGNEVKVSFKPGKNDFGGYTNANNVLEGHDTAELLIEEIKNTDGSVRTVYEAQVIEIEDGLEIPYIVTLSPAAQSDRDILRNFFVRMAIIEEAAKKKAEQQSIAEPKEEEANKKNNKKSE